MDSEIPVVSLSVCEALKEKFSTETELESFDNIILNSKAAILRQQSHERKRIIGLDHCNINRCGENDEIKNTCPLVEELDLSSNLLTEWDEILNITKQLDHLTSVNLSHNSLNDLSLPLNQSSELKDTVLKHLILNNTQTEFKTLIKILQFFPNISELHLSVNGISEVPEDLNVSFKSVKILHFAKNEIQQWSNVERIGKLFPCLSNLILSENPIECIPENINPQDIFPFLEKLNIMDTKISDWDSIDNLCKFPSLSGVHIKGSPVYMKSSDAKENRMIAVARLPHINTFNGSIIEEEERENAERMFIKYGNMKKTKQPKRHTELVKYYAEIDQTNDNLYDILIKGDVQEPFILKVDVSKPVSKIHKQIAARLDLKVKQFSLSLCEKYEQDCLSPSKQLLFNTKRLLDFPINSDDYIILKRFDVIDFVN